MRAPRFWAVAAVSLALAVWASRAFAGITEAQAKDAATRLAAALGWSYGPPSAVRPLEPVAADFPQYLVDFSGGAALIRVDADTGDVLGANDFAQSGALRFSGRPVEENLGEEEARQAAERVLDVWGRPADIRFERAYQHPDTKYWTFIWLRTFQGIPYIDDAIGIDVSPVDGKPILFGRDFPSAPPPTVEAKVSEQEAVAAARGAAAERNMAATAAALASARLMVVQPNDYWDARRNMNSRYPGAPSRVAWVVRFTKGDGYREFWVDAQDGSLLGGTQTRGASGPGNPPGAAGPAGPSGAAGGIMSSARARILLGSGLGLLALLGAFFVLRARRGR